MATAILAINLMIFVIFYVIVICVVKKHTLKIIESCEKICTIVEADEAVSSETKAAVKAMKDALEEYK